MNVDVTTVRWAEVHGSIFTEDEFEVRLTSKVTKLRVAIAFNLGQNVAQHVVELHNAQISAR